MDQQDEGFIKGGRVEKSRDRGRRGPNLDRRKFMRSAASVGIGALGATSLGAAGWGLITPALHFSSSAAAAPLQEPAVRSSQNGLLDTTLEAKVQAVHIGGRTVTTSVYEGSFPGPVMRVRPGDTFRVKLVNRLGDVPAGLPANSPFICTPVMSMAGGEQISTCDTNLHVHGLHVSPSNNSDNIFLTVKSGETFQYEYHIPSNHAAGLYWYHPHQHGTVTNQVFGGMAGPIIVEGDFDKLPGIAGVPERMLMLQATQLDTTGNVIDITNVAPAGAPGAAPGGPASQKNYLRMVNGQINPTMTIRPGETQRWRIANAAANITFRLHLDGHQLHQIAKDGHSLNATWSRDEIALAPGERAEVLIQGGAAGTYILHALPFAEGFTTTPDVTLATLVSAGSAMTPQPLPTTLLPFDDLSQAAVDRKRTIVFQFEPPIDPKRGTYWINYEQFNPNRDDEVVKLNTTEEWTIRNATANWHPFHIHINHYQVVAVNGQPVPPRVAEDTTNVPPFGEITMRTRFLDYTGRWVYHCHILLHEDHGMMGTVRANA